MWAEFFHRCQTDPLALLSMLDRERSKDSGSASMESMTGMWKRGPAIQGRQRRGRDLFLSSMTSRERHRDAPLSRCNCQIPLQGRRFHYPMLLLRSLTFNSLYSARQIPRLCALLSDSQLCLSDSSGWRSLCCPAVLCPKQC